MKKEFWVCEECQAEKDMKADDAADRPFRHPAGDARRIDLCADCWDKVVAVCRSFERIDTARGL